MIEIAQHRQEMAEQINRFANHTGEAKGYILIMINEDGSVSRQLNLNPNLVSLYEAIGSLEFIKNVIFEASE